MKQYERFSECLKRILDEEGISASEVARLVGFRSRNSIFRILTDQTSPKIQEEFLRMLHDKLGDQWSERHWLDLKESLEISRMGVSDYQSRQALLDLITNGQSSSQEVVVNIVEDSSGCKSVELRPLLRQLARQKECKLVICGCCSAPLIQLLAQELAAAGQEGRIHIRHYVHAGEDVVVQNVVAIQPLLYYRWYEALLVEPGSCPQPMEALYAASTMLVTATDEKGQVHYRHLLMHDEYKLFMVNSSDHGVTDVMLLLNAYAKKLSPLKIIPDFNPEPESYLNYINQYRLIEENRDVYSIKPDPSVSYIDPEILQMPLVDGFRESGFAKDDEITSLISLFYDVQKKRYENYIKKHKVTYNVFSLAAMREFMLTGKQSDHFYAMRPYTLAERLAILHHLRDQTMHNPYFCVRFLKENAPTPKMEITLYEGLGVMFTKAYTNYDLVNGDHAEALVTHPGFARKFRDFYMRELMPAYVMSYQETIAAMDELARLAADKG